MLIPLVISVWLTAANLRGERTEVFKLEKQIVPIEPGELVDLSTLSIKQEFPTKSEIERLLYAEEYRKIEWDGRDPD